MVSIKENTWDLFTVHTFVERLTTGWQSLSG